MFPLPIGRALLMSGAVIALGLGGILALPLSLMPEVDIRIEPHLHVVTVGEPFTINIVVESSTPVNVFTGELQFDESVLAVDSISYNTSIADLWAETPWYSNGEGTLNFIGGTTVAGGFTGEGSLMSVVFRPVATGEVVVTMTDARVLKHDGIGSDAVLRGPIDALFTVADAQITSQTILKKTGERTRVAVTTNPPSTDLNADGKQSLTDVSIFMQHLVTQNLRSDFNQDGTVGTADLSILLNQ